MFNPKNLYDMKKLFVLLFAGFLFANSFSQNLGALLAPMPGTEMIEYVQIKYLLDPATDKIQNVTISNGNITEKIGRDFKSVLELYNVLGRAGWVYINETKKEDKTMVQYSVSFSRKLQNRMTGNQRPPMDSMRRAPQNQSSPTPPPPPAPSKEKK